jgi:hypothetical protein
VPDIFDGDYSARNSTGSNWSARAVSPTLCAVETRFPPRLYCRGEQPMTLLKAVLNALSDPYPSDGAMTEMGSVEFASRSPASSIRQRVSYSMGDVPTLSLNFRVKTVRDMPARSDSNRVPQRIDTQHYLAVLYAASQRERTAIAARQ